MHWILAIAAALILTACTTGVRHVPTPTGSTTDEPAVTEVRTDFPNGG